MIEGIHHLGLTVRDADASAAWYVDVLGFHRVGAFESPDGARRKVFLRHEGLQIRLGPTGPAVRAAPKRTAKRSSSVGMVKP